LKILIRLISIILFLCPTAALAWPSTPPRIGHLVLSQEYWGYIIEAAHDYDVSPYIIQGVLAIESRYDPCATSGRGRCIGLMQLDRGVARLLQVNPLGSSGEYPGRGPGSGAALEKHDGNLLLAVREYNGTGNRAYEREVIRAVRQAERGEKQ
jgi:hypothetical protein